MFDRKMFTRAFYFFQTDRQTVCDYCFPESALKIEALLLRLYGREGRIDWDGDRTRTLIRWENNGNKSRRE
jgi:hypothetical protein